MANFWDWLVAKPSQPAERKPAPKSKQTVSIEQIAPGSREGQARQVAAARGRVPAPATLGEARDSYIGQIWKSGANSPETRAAYQAYGDKRLSDVGDMFKTAKDAIRIDPNNEAPLDPADIPSGFAPTLDPKEQPSAASAKARAALLDVDAKVIKSEENVRETPNLWNGEAKELSREEYLALSPRQRAAAEFNAALKGAVEADLAEGGEADAEYSKRVEGLFGKNGGSDRFAPRTVALLETLGLSNTEDGDLDNYLDLQAFVTDDQLGKLGDSTITESGGDAQLEHALTVSSQTQTLLVDTLSRGQTLLNSLQQATAKTPELFGAAPTALGADPANNEQDYYLDLLFQQVSDPSADPNEIRSNIGEYEATYNVPVEQIAAYIDRRLAGVEQGLGLGIFDQGALAPQSIRSQYIREAG